jgi:hypothetical protein
VRTFLPEIGNSADIADLTVEQLAAEAQVLRELMLLVQIDGSLGITIELGVVLLLVWTCPDSADGL